MGPICDGHKKTGVPHPHLGTGTRCAPSTPRHEPGCSAGMAQPLPPEQARLLCQQCLFMLLPTAEQKSQELPESLAFTLNIPPPKLIYFRLSQALLPPDTNPAPSFPIPAPTEHQSQPWLLGSEPLASSPAPSMGEKDSIWAHCG